MKGGRGHLKFRTRKKLLNAVNAYFENTEKELWTVTGLALALGTTRKTLMEYQKKEQFGDIIETAKLKIENKYELLLATKTCTGAIFALKNMGWSDRREQDIDFSARASVEAILEEIEGDKY